jgi:hypothetical protein
MTKYLPSARKAPFRCVARRLITASPPRPVGYQRRGVAPAKGDDDVMYVTVNPFTTHRIEPPSTEVETSKSEIIGMFTQAYMMRRLEIAADVLYKAGRGCVTPAGVCRVGYVDKRVVGGSSPAGVIIWCFFSIRPASAVTPGGCVDHIDWMRFGCKNNMKSAANPELPTLALGQVHPRVLPPVRRPRGGVRGHGGGADQGRRHRHVLPRPLHAPRPRRHAPRGRGLAGLFTTLFLVIWQSQTLIDYSQCAYGSRN